MAEFTLSLCEEVIRTKGKCGMTSNEMVQLAWLAKKTLSVPSETAMPDLEAAAIRWKNYHCDQLTKGECAECSELWCAIHRHMHPEKVPTESERRPE